ncbi:hypothetical protein FB45DRAFT_1033581 [Roridomyces roridus]|uniref:CxC1-like cysteine cluster associated with KDZ transposases domain-containing protein n=1 Tax=Roridomyces roridus TaxID=1738132 RepID=A0AAD7BFN6_9AGAR|nr:hypothetical protein FB45DRAFT_1033581 [Roridomyces roridus]
MSIRRFKGRSRTWQVLGSTTGVDDCAPAPPVKKLRLGPMKLAQYQDNRAIQRKETWDVMSTTNRQNLLALQEMAAAPEFDASNAPDLLTVAGVLDGTHEAQISHAGGDHGGETLEDIIELTERARTRCKDTRTRRDRTQKRNDAFAAQMPSMLKAYSAFRARGKPDEGDEGQPELYQVTVIDLFTEQSETLSLPLGCGGFSAALLRLGLVPSAPWTPTFVFTMATLDFYRVSHARCPQFSIYAFTKTLADLHGVPVRSTMHQHFSIALDLYLDLRRRTELQVLTHLGREDPAWRMKNCCPACSYRLEGEDELIFSMLVTMDGNDSLKRVLRRGPGDDGPGETNERWDDRDASDGYYLPRAQVDEWARRRLANILPSDDNGAENPCKERWKNMLNDVTAKMWGIFDETGLFLCLCRHGFALVMVDMLRSGELSKYPLAVLKHFGVDIGVGYNIGCHFCTTLDTSELGPKAREARLRCLVGSFHGHAHNRLCQVCFLALYVKGLGIEDLEGCERRFSRSNALAGCSRRASRFHRQQEITGYFKHMDDYDVYASLATFLCSNYEQSLKILDDEPIVRQMMRDEDVVDGEEFVQALADETVYLQELWKSSKKAEDTPETRYVACLVAESADLAKVTACRAAVRQSRSDDAAFTPGKTKADMALRHALEKRERSAMALADIEQELGITTRWTPTSPSYIAAEEEARSLEYQRALDRLELLVVERLFELTKMNQSGTGYKMRKHIAKSLQARSKAVRSAVAKYNAAAAAVTPPRDHVDIEQVLEYAFLADFDLLRHSHHEVHRQYWARPAYRAVMNRWFRLERAREEIKRLDVEIRRFVTWMRDESVFLHKRERELRWTEGKTEQQVEDDHALAVHLAEYRERRGRFEQSHMMRLHTLKRRWGTRCTASLTPGVPLQSVSPDEDEEDQMLVDAEREVGMAGGEEPTRQADDDEDHSEGEDDEAHDEQVSDLLFKIAGLGIDAEERGESITE